MRHLVIGQRQKAPNFSAFHWSPHGCLITIGQHFVTTRVVHLPKRTETSLITESDQSRANHQLLQQLCTVRTAWSGSDQAVRAAHSCKRWLLFFVVRLFVSCIPATTSMWSKHTSNETETTLYSNITTNSSYTFVNYTVTTPLKVSDVQRNMSKYASSAYEFWE